MKKILGAILAMMVAVSGLAFAETVTGTGNLSLETVSEPVNPENRYMLIELADGLALIGAGDGVEAFDSFASGDALYADRFEDFWTALSALMPVASADGTLSFAPNGRGGTLVSADGTAIAELNGVQCFAIVRNDQTVEIAEGCDVRVWTSAGVRAGEGDICPNCGQIDDGGAKHTTVISGFCKESHTVCMGEVTHTCEACGREYPCEKSNSHTECIVCGQPWCYKDKGDHKEQPCGHRGCESFESEEAHAECPGCDGYLCDEKDHTLAACGAHHADAEGDHTAAACGVAGHFACDGRNHTQCTLPTE